MTTEAGKIVGDALDRHKQSIDAARKTAEEIDAQRERERAAGAVAREPAPSPAPVEPAA